VQTKEDLDRELDEWDRRHPGLKVDERFVAWFVRAYSTDDETKAIESLSGASGEKGIDALLIDDSNDLVTVVQGKHRDSIMRRGEKSADVMEFANLAKELSAEDKEFRESDALDYHEEKIREAVERFEAPLRVRLNRPARVPRPSPTTITIVGILVAIAIAVVGWIFFYAFVMTGPASDYVLPAELPN
jgi:hypothetical protein